MGVPAMFRWLSQKYPKIVSSVAEELPKKIGDNEVPVDRTAPNPNGEEFDNLYLDMNGIVHPCSHPEDRPAPKTEADMMLAIFEYMDRLIGMVRPRKLLYLAVDGVAPRAKMNQQRARRFRSAQEAKEKDQERAEFQQLLTAQKASRGEAARSLEGVIEKTWDSNAITPGTPFMHLLAESLQYWCAFKFTTDPSWKNIKVIISDASVPGEGEHKMMNFIRSQRAMPTHDPNTSHVIVGLDADLIMLSLATHEPHFRVLREDVFFDSGKDKVCTRCGRKGHIRTNCEFPDDGKKLTQEEAEEEWAHADHGLKPHIWLHTNILREYLAVEMDTPKRKFKYDLERSLDDWVFMCFFVGNDFLPHLPSLEIRDQGIDLLISIWRDLAAEMDDYVTKDGFADMHRVQQILSALAAREADIFKKRKEVSDRQAVKRAQREAQNNGNKRQRRDDNTTPAHPSKRHKEDINTYTNSGIVFFDPKNAQSKEVRDVHKDMLHHRDAQSNKSAAAKLKELMKAKAKGDHSSETQPTQEPGSVADSEASVLEKSKADELEDADNGTPGRNTPIVPRSPPQSAAKNNDGAPEDTVKLWEDGYEERYYDQKFHVAPDDIAFRNKVARQYAEGLCWVLAYYMQGCPSWNWYFPHHYAPFAADFIGLEDMDPRRLFEKGVPFHPYEQLMGVLPAASNQNIPEPFRILMEDPNSPIIDFYPEDFVTDLNGKKFAWQGTVILPFIDEKRLLENMALKYPELTDEEKKRNEFGKETLIFSQEGGLFEDVEKALYRKGQQKHKIDPAKSGALHGDVEPHDLFVLDSQLVPPFDVDGDTEFDIIQDGSMRVYYDMPLLSLSRAHKSTLLNGVRLPKPALGPGEAEAVRKSNERGGFRGGYRGRGGRGNFHEHRNGDHQSGGGRGGYSSGRVGRERDWGSYGGQQNHLPPSSNPWPAPSGGRFVPLPPPGWVASQTMVGGDWHDGNNGHAGPLHHMPPAQRPARAGNSGPIHYGRSPPCHPPNNKSLQNERFYRPADEILGRSNGNEGRSQHNNTNDSSNNNNNNNNSNPYSDRPPRSYRGGQGGRGRGSSGDRYKNEGHQSAYDHHYHR